MFLLHLQTFASGKRVHICLSSLLPPCNACLRYYFTRYLKHIHICSHYKNKIAVSMIIQIVLMVFYLSIYILIDKRQASADEWLSSHPTRQLAVCAKCAPHCCQCVRTASHTAVTATSTIPQKDYTCISSLMDTRKQVYPNNITDAVNCLMST